MWFEAILSVCVLLLRTSSTSIVNGAEMNCLHYGFGYVPTGNHEAIVPILHARECHERCLSIRQCIRFRFWAEPHRASAFSEDVARGLCDLMLDGNIDARKLRGMKHKGGRGFADPRIRKGNQNELSLQHNLSNDDNVSHDGGIDLMPFSSRARRFVEGARSCRPPLIYLAPLIKDLVETPESMSIIPSMWSHAHPSASSNCKFKASSLSASNESSIETARFGSDVRSFDSYELCEGYCTSIPSCVSFSYSQDNKACSLHKLGAKRIHSSNSADVCGLSLRCPVLNWFQNTVPLCTSVNQKSQHFDQFSLEQDLLRTWHDEVLSCVNPRCSHNADIVVVPSLPFHDFGFSKVCLERLVPNSLRRFESRSLSLYLSISLSLSLYLSFSLYLSIHLSIYISLYLYLSIHALCSRRPEFGIVVQERMIL